jgi:rare lipoprotein A
LRRFRRRRRRLGALALLPLAALAATTTISASAATSSQTPELDASRGKVRFGKAVTLRGAFANADGQSVQIQYQAKRGNPWRSVARTRTSEDGAYRARVKPRATGNWRARLDRPTARTSSTTLAADDSQLATETGPKSIKVRSRTRAGVSGRHLTVGRKAKIRGRVLPGTAGRDVVVRVGGRSIATETNRNGKFKARWRAGRTGSYKVRVIAEGNRAAAGSRTRAGKVTVYRPAAASWYGPGFYGNRTGCGQTLTTSTLGVAHKTMPCGTKLRLRYRGRSVAVRVIDRGPYAGDREFDLTAATKQRLGFPSTGTVLSSK